MKKVFVQLWCYYLEPDDKQEEAGCSLHLTDQEAYKYAHAILLNQSRGEIRFKAPWGLTLELEIDDITYGKVVSSGGGLHLNCLPSEWHIPSRFTDVNLWKGCPVPIPLA